MADYRCIYRNAGTGERTSGLSHLGFRVWIQYQLSADDFGVCPATAAKLQGDSDALHAETPRRVQNEIENLIAIGLCGSFMDGKKRYLYQPDWQDWQRLRHASSTALPAPPAETLQKCSAKTVALFEQFHRNFTEGLRPHAGACDAPATATADAVLVEGGPGETPPKPVTATVRVGPARESVADRAAALGLVKPGAWDRQHASHAFRGYFCGWVCLPQSVVDGFVGRATGAGADHTEALAGVHAWALSVKARWATSGQIPGEDIFGFWRNEWTREHGTNKPAATRPSGTGLDRLMNHG